jgi:hypothetical protein
MYRYIEPEVSGGFGKDTILDNSVHPPMIKKLHFVFDGWLGDDILESFPCFIVTDSLRKKIESEGMTGLIFDNLKISKSQTFKTLYKNKQLPTFYWAKINGKYKNDDFSLGEDYRLIVSEKAFLILKEFNTNNAIFEEITDND